MKKRKILATSALTYANGPLHIGHLVEYIQTDIWVRFQRSYGNDCLYVGGNDAHGTPIMIAAQKLGITPEELVQRYQKEHLRDLADFHVQLDSFYSTHAPENKKLTYEFYDKLTKRGDITTKTIAQAYDPEAKMFLPDRYVKGECPHCGAKDQYGDNCEVCGSTYSPMDLKNPKSVITGATPIEKESLHYFFQLGNYTDWLKQWTHNKHLQTEITNKLDEWFAAGLQPWDISRDAPYFGFEIPDAPGKYFYVWLDAPIGYMTSFQHLCQERPGLSFDEYWQPDSKVELYHFIGKDIVYFHALFWPALLHGANYRTPTAVYVHGFLTVKGQKMSKSRGTFINARQYLNHLNPEYLRYYFAAKLSAGIDDIDINFDDFIQRTNSDLVGKVVNIASRCAGFIHKSSAGKLAATLPEPKLYEQFVTAGEQIAKHYENRQYQFAVREIMTLADVANQYIDEQKPWSLAKQPGTETQIQAICTQSLNLFYVLMIYLQPILPQLAQQAAEFLNVKELNWHQRQQALLNQTIEPFKPLLQRIAPESITQMLEENKAETII